MLLGSYSNDNRESIGKTMASDALKNKIEKLYTNSFSSARQSSVCGVLSSDENSANLIKWVLKDENHREVESSNPMYEFVKGSAKHSVITFFSDERQSYSNLTALYSL